MRGSPRHGRYPWLWVAAAFLCVAAAAAAGPSPAPQPPQPPHPPEAPELPERPAIPEITIPADSGAFTIPKGETHEGDLKKFSSAVVIEGTQAGDLTVWAGSLVVTGRVAGELSAKVGSATISGEVDDDAEIWSGSTNITGTVRGNLTVYGGTLVLSPGAHVTGSLKAFVQECTMDGTVDADLEATGGVVSLGGKVGGDAVIESETFTPGAGAKVGGDLTYSSRSPVSLEGKGVVGGEIRSEEHKASTHVNTARRRTDEGSHLVLIGFICTMIFGPLAVLASRRFLPYAVETIGRDPLRSLGTGFVVALTPIAVTFTAILIVTIPLIALYWIAFVLVAFFAKVPVAVWLGRFGWVNLGRPEPSVWRAFLVGVPALYLLIAIPYLGNVIWVAATLLGLGAFFLGVREQRNARRAAAAAALDPPSAAEAS